ncbi:MAG: hypothetical protein HY431_01395 [Candidatus Levybacteria bacterium]|nr:hypothetical protein [Candidatus Levybacteria bacterium]
MGEKIAPLQRLQIKRADKATVIDERTKLLARIDRLRTNLKDNIAMHQAQLPNLDQQIEEGTIAAFEDHQYSVRVGQWEVTQVGRLLDRGDIFEGENKGIVERGLSRRKAELRALMAQGETDPIIRQGQELLRQREAKPLEVTSRGEPLEEEPARKETAAPLPPMRSRVRRFEPVSGEKFVALPGEKAKSVETAKPEEVKKEPRILYIHTNSQTVILKYEAGALRVQFNKDNQWGFVKELINRSDTGAEFDALKRLAADLHITSRYPVGDTIDDIRIRFKYFDKALADIITRTESGGYRLDAIPKYIEDRKTFEAIADNLGADKIRQGKPQAQKAEPAKKPAMAIPEPAEAGVSPAPVAATSVRRRERVEYEPGPDEMLTEEEKLVVRAVVNALKRDHIWPNGIEEEVAKGLQSEQRARVRDPLRYTSAKLFELFESGYRKMDEKQSQSPRLLKYWTKDDLMLWERIHGTDSVVRMIEQLPKEHAIRALWQEIIDEHDNQKIGGIMVDLQTQTSRQFLNKIMRKIKEGFIFYDRERKE